MTVSEEQLKAHSKAPRVMEEDLEAAIASVFYYTAGQGVEGASQMGTRPAGRADSLNRLTFCTLVLQNGFTVTGQSACVSPDNFDPDIGKRIALSDAKGKIWAFLGYELQSKLALVNSVYAPRDGIVSLGSAAGAAPATYVGTKVVHALPMSRIDYNIFRGWQLPEGENGFDEGYLVEYTDGGQINVPGFSGYVSWSPRAVFEGSYQQVGQAKPSTFISRMVDEKEALVDRVAKLDVFVKSATFDELPKLEQSDLIEQLRHMQDYLWVLTRRLKRTGHLG